MSYSELYFISIILIIVKHSFTTGRAPVACKCCPISDYLCRYCHHYKPSQAALAMHVNPKMKRSRCAEDHKPRGKANYFDWIKCKYECPIEGCNSSSISEQFIKNHLNKVHKIKLREQHFDFAPIDKTNVSFYKMTLFK